MMRTMLSGLLATALLLCVAQAVSASFTYDLAVTGGFTGTGQITFEALTGTDASNISAFNFTAIGGSLGTTTFDKDDIGTVGWTIAAGLASFNLFTGLATSTTGTFNMLLLNLDPSGPTVHCPGLASIFPGPSSLLIGCGPTLPFVFTLGTMTATVVPTAVPEPATVGLLALGLAGLGFARRAIRPSAEKR